MPSEKKTEFLGLSDWQATDHPKTEDWAGDNRRVDAFALEVDESIRQMEVSITEAQTGLAALEGKIAYSTTDLTAGSSALDNGNIYLVYE